jgi:hypothetical protein
MENFAGHIRVGGTGLSLVHGSGKGSGGTYMGEWSRSHDESGGDGRRFVCATEMAGRRGVAGRWCRSYV